MTSIEWHSVSRLTTVLPPIRRLSEFAYAVIALLMLTQGPVYRLWSDSATFLGTAPQPSIPHAHFATFIAVQIPALVLLSRQLDLSFFSSRAAQLLLALLGWLGLSVLWSTLARHSLPEFVALACTTSFGIYLATRFTLGELWRIVAVAMALGLGLSLFAIRRGWDASVNLDEDYWIGIYYNRNSLAPVAAVALLAFIGLAFTTSLRRTIDVAVLAAGVVLAGVAALILWRTESLTSPLALLVAVGALVLWLLVRLATQRIAARRWQNVAAPIAMAIAAVAVFVALRTIGGLASVSGETATFNSRGGLWAQSWAGFLEKPWLGWGWMAARRTLDFDRVGKWWAVIDTEWSHNGYHDLLLGGGVLAAVLFVGIVFFGVGSIDQTASLRTTVPSFLMISFVLAAATQESFFIGSHFVWAMLIAMLFVDSGTQRKALVDEHHAGN